MNRPTAEIVKSFIRAGKPGHALAALGLILLALVLLSVLAAPPVGAALGKAIEALAKAGEHKRLPPHEG